MLPHRLDAARLAQSGWTEIHKTTIRDVPLDYDPWAFTDHGENLLTLPNNRAAPVWARWIASHSDYYRKAHLGNPVCQLTPAEMQAVFAAGDLLAEHAVSSENDGQIDGFASLRTTPDTRIVEAGWMWSAKGLSGLKPLWEWLVERAVQSGFQTISLEADTSDPELYSLLELLPSEQDEHFWTWERRA